MIGRATRARRLGRAAVPLLALALLASACTSGASGTSPASTASSGPATGAQSSAPSDAGSLSSDASSSPAAPAVELTTTPGKRTDVNPTTPITVTAKNGTLSSVVLKNAAGEVVTGAMSADKTSWHTTEVLGYSKTYKLVAVASDPSTEGGRTLKQSFTTLTPPNTFTMPYFDTIYGSAMQNGATYGIGMIPVVNFDENIVDKAAAERHLLVTTSPHVDGSWYWTDDHTAHWRPQHFYQPGTKVTITAKVYGVDVGNGIYGQADKSISYRIGASHISIANAATHHVKVYFDGKLKRTMPTSMGQGGTTPGKNGQTIYLWTMPGTYTVIGHENPATMSSDSYGLPASSPYGYAAEKVPWATKISVDGIYLHELDTTVWAQGSQNLSHGCLNLNKTNAEWYYKTSRVGDIVKVVHSGGPKLQLWQGGDWTLTWQQWQQGSALS